MNEREVGQDLLEVKKLVLSILNFAYVNKYLKDESGPRVILRLGASENGSGAKKPIINGGLDIAGDS